MYLQPGDRLCLEELLYGLMLVSGNDAALAVAHCVSGSVEAFVLSPYGNWQNRSPARPYGPASHPDRSG